MTQRVLRHRRAAVLFAAAAVLYFGLGCLLTLRYNFVDGDAISRVANAGYVVQSRDPHLSAVGFVWNPLPSLVEIPILQWAHWWSPIRRHGLAGVVQSAAFMSAAVVVVDGIARDRRLPGRWRAVAVAAFALQPMILVYGASGMSEAAQTFCMLWCVRRLLRWVHSRHPADLACAGLALGVGYLARYEVLAAGAGAAVFAGVVTAYDTAAPRVARVAANIALVTFPLVVAAAIWALSGWVLNQQLFATLSSRYGNEAIVHDAITRGAAFAPSGADTWLVIAARLLGMQPFAGIACAVAVLVAAITRRSAPLVPLAVIGPILIFSVWGQYTAATFGLFRYYLLAIPLVICVALALWSPSGDTPALPAVRDLQRSGAALLSASVLIGFPATVAASLNDRIGNQALQFGFNSLLFPDRVAPALPEQVPYRRVMIEERELAGYLDRLNLPRGAVLMDTFKTWGVWLSSSRPDQFVITSDYDFKAALNRPWAHGIHYLLSASPDEMVLGALGSRYPTLWEDGAGMAVLDYAVSGIDGRDRLRLYRVTGPPRRPGDELSEPVAASPSSAPRPAGR